MSVQIPLLALADLTEGRGRRIVRGGLDIAVFRVGDSAFAIDDSCPHSGGSLANGRVEGTTVRCPVHGLPFDLAGRASRCDGGFAIRRYPVRIVDGVVVLDDAR